MEIIRGRHNLRPAHRGSVLTVGNFDGVHRGHRVLLDETCRRARARGLAAVLVTFEPLTPEYFTPARAPARLTTLAEKIVALASSGLDRLLVLRFDAALAALSAREFAEQILAAGLGAAEVVVGDDFRFGHGGRGDHALLAAEGARLGFEVVRIETQRRAGGRISSTRIREALAGGDLATAGELLGRPFTMCARVARGQRLGQQLGFPTANLPVRRLVCPVSGVFAVEARVAPGGEWWPGVANVGTRPTVGGGGTLLEVHLLDRAVELYGRRMEVRLVERLRAERRFASLAELERQLERDCQAARAALGMRPPGRALA